MPEQFDEKAVFLTALQLPIAAREEYLRTVCPDHAAVERVRSLLARHDNAEAGGDSPPSPGPETGAHPPSGEPRLIGEFKIIRLLGEGGMGRVYLAEDLTLGRRVAVKILRSPVMGGPESVDRFRDEARRTAALKHPGIVSVFRFGIDGDRHFIASEYVDGPTLRELIERRAEQTRLGHDTRRAGEWRREAAEIVAAVADALDHCHRHLLIHRDVKPSNILIDRDAGPRLTDFGIARHISDGARYDQTQLIGSCHYMSPEQASAASIAVDRRTDVFSLGVVLYEMLLLQRPFDGKDSYGVLQAVISQSPVRPRSVDPRLPRQLEIVVLKALEKNPVHRYQSAAHLAADLRSWLTGDPVLAAPPGLVRRARQVVHARRFALGLIACSIAAALLTVWAFVRLDDDRPSLITAGLPSDAQVWVQHWTENGGQGRLRRLGPGASGPFRIDPGAVRVTIRQDSERFAEVARWLDPGETVRVDVPLRPIDEVTDQMVLVVPEALGIASDPARPTVPAFWIDLHEVSNADYAAYLSDPAIDAPPPPIWTGGAIMPGWENLPVVGVTLDEARAYAEWAGKRLPTAEEWRWAVAASGNAPPGGWADAPQDANQRSPISYDLWVAALDESDPDYRPGPGVPTKAQTRAERAARLRQVLVPVDAGPPPRETGPPTPLHLLDNVFEWTDTSRGIHTYSDGRASRLYASFGDLRGALSPNDAPDPRRSEQLPPSDSRILILGFRCAKTAAPGTHP